VTTEAVQPISDEDRAEFIEWSKRALATVICNNVLALNARLTAAEKRADEAEAQGSHNLDLRDELGRRFDAMQDHCRITAEEWEAERAEAGKERRARIDLQRLIRDALVELAMRVQNDHGVWVIRRPHADMHAIMARVGVAMQASATAQTDPVICPSCHADSRFVPHAPACAAGPQVVTMDPRPARVLTEECCHGCGAPWGTRHAETCRNVPIAKVAP